MKHANKYGLNFLTLKATNLDTHGIYGYPTHVPERPSLCWLLDEVGGKAYRHESWTPFPLCILTLLNAFCVSFGMRFVIIYNLICVKKLCLSIAAPSLIKLAIFRNFTVIACVLPKDHFNYGKRKNLYCLFLI